MESDGAHHSMAWDARNRMAAVYQGDADTTNSAILDQYLYDADAYRVVRWPLSGDGKPIIAIRDAAGQTMTEFRAEPGTQRVSRVKEYVTGAGQILVERAISVGMVTHATQSPLSTGGNYSMSLTSGMGGSSYAVDIRTASGSSRLVTGIHPDAQGNYSIAESDLFPGEANFVRIRKDTGEPESYSPPATIVYDPNVNAQSPNVIQALSASRQGNAIILRWSFAASSTKKTRLYFERADGQGVVPLTANGLAAGVTSLSILGTALAAPCGSFYATQLVTGQPESIPSSSAPLPNQVSDFGVGGGFGGGGTCQDPPPPPNPTPTLVYSDGFHHRDHLGSLRVVTDSAGRRVSGHDYFPFGTEIFATGEGDDGGASRRRFTGHERAAASGMDYMLGRSFDGAIASFVTADPFPDIDMADSRSWNAYSYVRNNPMNYWDPDGFGMRFALEIKRLTAMGILPPIMDQVMTAREPSDWAETNYSNGRVTLAVQDELAGRDLWDKLLILRHELNHIEDLSNPVLRASLNAAVSGDIVALKAVLEIRAITEAISSLAGGAASRAVTNYSLGQLARNYATLRSYMNDWTRGTTKQQRELLVAAMVKQNPGMSRKEAEQRVKEDIRRRKKKDLVDAGIPEGEL